MRHDKQFRSRRQVLASAGHLSIGGVIAPALASAALSSPAEAIAVSQLGSSEEPTEVTPEKVVDALEKSYGQHSRQRRNHTKGVGARGESLETRKPQSTRAPPCSPVSRWRVVARFSLAGGYHRGLRCGEEPTRNGAGIQNA